MGVEDEERLLGRPTDHGFASNTYLAETSYLVFPRGEVQV